MIVICQVSFAIVSDSWQWHKVPTDMFWRWPVDCQSIVISCHQVKHLNWPRYWWKHCNRGLFGADEELLCYQFATNAKSAIRGTYFRPLCDSLIASICINMIKPNIFFIFGWRLSLYYFLSKKDLNDFDHYYYWNNLLWFWLRGRKPRAKN